MVDFQHVNKLYEGHQALDDVSFNISKGTIFGLLGPNGAGKTTILRLLVRILLPDSGNIFFDDKTLKEEHLRQIGYLPEERGLYPKMRAYDHLVFLARLKGVQKNDIKTRIAYWAEKLQVGHLLSRKVENLSKGQQQKIQLIATLLHEPILLILDEPFSGFDPVNAELWKQIMLELKLAGKTLLISTHRMESAEELCDDVAMLHHGKMVLNGSLKEVIQSKVLNRYRVRTDKPLVANEIFDVLERVEDESRIQVKESVSSNELLESLMAQSQVIAFVPERRSLREVFLENAR
ncbi:MAG TPA: ABC transporter ATP-binding protein [Cytophagales bacterium]|nr:ABC transporter ATP-binding protein [Cytophagales bacterium]